MVQILRNTAIAGLSIKANDEAMTIGDKGGSFKVSKGAPIDLKLKLTAALKAHTMSFSSVDYLLRRYGDQWRQQIEKGRGFWDD